MRRLRHRAEHLDPPEVAPERDWRLDDEFDAFLGGLYVEWAEAHGRPIPQWAWINPLAHATVDELRARTSVQPSPQHTQTDLWRQVLAFLAGQVLARTGSDPAVLEELQRRVLVPLELHAASAWVVRCNPGDVGTIVLRVLEADRKDMHDG